ncbi:MAG: hypothetical protein IH899_20980 [Planctomycetes bacterium]|nr:hypothetical protein [Planctomycetota bacterium]
MIYDRLVSLNGEKSVRANALELLENVIEPDIRKKLTPIFNDEATGGSKRLTRDSVLAEFMERQDRWRALCALFMIKALKIKHLYPQVETAATSGTPVVATVAQFLKKKMTH